MSVSNNNKAFITLMGTKIYRKYEKTIFKKGHFSSLILVKYNVLNTLADLYNSSIIMTVCVANQYRILDQSVHQ